MKESNDKLKNWIINSGISESSNDPLVNRAVRLFYDLKNNTFGFLYPEITGYFIDTMYFLYNTEK